MTDDALFQKLLSIERGHDQPQVADAAPPVGEASRSGRIFVSAVADSPPLTGQFVPLDVVENLPWRFLSFDLKTRQWEELPGDAAGYFFVAPDSSGVVYCKAGTLWFREHLSSARSLLRLPDPGGFIYEGAWAPDSRHFAASCKIREARTGARKKKTWLLDVDRGGQLELPLSPTDGVRDWSCDGRWLAVSRESSPDRERQAYIVRPNGSAPRLIATAGAACTQIRFSPDGRRFCTTRGPRRNSLEGPDPRERGAVWVTDIDGRNDCMVFGRSEFCCQDVRWSPDGRWLAFQGFERCEVPSCEGGMLDLAKPFIKTILLEDMSVEDLSLPAPFQLVRESSFDWK